MKRLSICSCRKIFIMSKHLWRIDSRNATRHNVEIHVGRYVAWQVISTRYWVVRFWRLTIDLKRQIDLSDFWLNVYLRRRPEVVASRTSICLTSIVFDGKRSWLFNFTNQSKTVEYYLFESILVQKRWRDWWQIQSSYQEQYPNIQGRIYYFLYKRDNIKVDFRTKKQLTAIVVW
jgi:hypothetical protein